MSLDHDQQRRQRRQSLDPEDKSLRAHNKAASERIDGLPEFDWQPTCTGVGQLPARLHHYVLEEALGLALVLATDRRTEQRVVVRILWSTERLNHDTPWYQLDPSSHPRLGLPVDKGHWQDREYIVLPFFEGPTLSDHLDGQALSNQESATIVRQCAQSLQQLHDLGLTHRDLQEGCVRLTAKGPVILNLPIIDDGPDDDSRMRVGVPIHAPASWSPEKIQGTPITPLSDVYQLGYLLFYCLTAQPPAPDQGSIPETLRSLMYQGAPAPRTINPEVSEELDRITHQAMAFNPEDRYQSAQDLAEDLQRFLAGKPVRAQYTPRPSPPPAPEAPASRSLWANIRHWFGGRS